MGLSITLQQFLDHSHIDYDTLVHQRTTTASETAKAAHIPGSRLVKAVVIKDDDGFMMVLLPASHHIRFGELQGLLERRVELATEDELSPLFADCDKGAIPALGMAYGLDVLVEDALVETGDLYFEGGDHATLVHMQADAFNCLMGEATHGHFTRSGDEPIGV